ncbi:amidase family protein [Pseudonocardia sp. MH-G8]|uniref:amidase family protein n=1 Tax=Pseudonocardia sp. MH-G8 TaxID=1854588 RepID=UPI001E293E81|nr:amidase family protein [Pseudonocardia sp. MH-G8]
MLDRSVAPEIADSAHPVIPKRLEGYRAALARAGTERSPGTTRLLQQNVPALQRSLAQIFEEERVDALVFATTPCSANVRFDARDDSYRCAVPSAFMPSCLASASGLPQVSVPTELDSTGVPIGLSFLGSGFDERRLLALARAWEDRNGLVRDPAATP